eukprot:TRINITY_DN2756_c0_g1_i2.p1 TRINITY_DN2756_c0_g1~~TRINITY_DN2756_c0_g1_i2.p1  ORF type:complete len:107 (+),score=31.96 TRINITY_DN2756_c0_g1_i2:173-493(+)
MLRSLVGSEMCIRDRDGFHKMSYRSELQGLCRDLFLQLDKDRDGSISTREVGLLLTCLLYTSDAADEEDSVDLGGRRIIKKKKKINKSVDIIINKTKLKNEQRHLI